ncbi:MAG: hypothetical protein H0Z19_08445 [Archaeoglobus sp.]|uniref:hypothetical protein n=1 Tax=Archaeoglobus sp. TaxID=1872626 RepID=UPI001DE96224|nr:hypothetical protein [Archaeoglobus sp.]MBO8180489.1 hypothetical protein [Archaeoglobus sp.]
MRLGNKTLDTVESFSAGETVAIEIPRDRFIKEIDLFVTMNIKNGGSSAVSVTESQIISLLERLRVVVNGRDTLIDVNAYRKFLMDYFTFNTKTYTNIPTSIGAGETKTFEFEIPIIFAVDPVVEWDLNAVVPAHLTSSFYVYVEMGDPADIDADLSFSGTNQIETTVKELYVSSSEEKQILSNLRKVYEIEVAKAIDATYTSYTYKVDLDVGNIIQKIGIFAYDSGNALSNSVIEAFQIKQDSPVDVILEKITWKQSRAEDKRMYDMESLPDGITIYDAEFKMGGLDTRGLKSGDVKFKANTSATGQVVLYHREIV